MFDGLDLDEPIGARGRDDRSAGNRGARVRGGSLNGVAYDLAWDERTSGGTIGDIKLMVKGRVIWGESDTGLRLDLAPVLRQLARNWNALLLQETYPLGVVPLSPSRFESDFRRLLQRQAEESLGSADDETPVSSFRSAHNLAGWFGTDLSDLWMVREANEMIIEEGGEVVRWPFFDVVRTLQSLGEAIAARVEQVCPDAEVALRWRARDSAVNDNEALSTAIGLPLSDTLTLIDRKVLRVPPSRQALLRGLDEMQAAARMLGACVDLDDITTVLREIGEVPKVATPLLDEVAEEAREALRGLTQSIPYEQGHELARWLRERLQLEGAAAADPAAILTSWGVPVRPILIASNVEAVSVWGEQHGPAVLHNLNGSRSQGRIGASILNSGGARATLAHEICHFLVDRGRALPVLEVLGGSTPKRLEQRANAFAAEFLLPMRQAYEVYQNLPVTSEALSELMKRFGVTKLLAAEQLRNYGITTGVSFSRNARDYLNNIVGRQWGI